MMYSDCFSIGKGQAADMLSFNIIEAVVKYAFWQFDKNLMHKNKANKI